MKKLSKLFNSVLAGALFCFVLGSCENFLAGGNVRKEIEDAIAEANAQKINIIVSADEGTGTTFPLGNYDAKLGYSFQLTFSENPKYSFVKWQAVNPENSDQVITEGVKFEDATQLKTKVTVSTKDPIRIMPLCVERIAIQGEPSPMYERNPDGVSRDRSILVRFTKKVSPESFIFSEEEIEKLPENAVLNKTQIKGNEVVTSYTIPKEEGTGGITYFKNVTITDEYGLSMAEHFMAPSIEDSLLTIAVNKQKPIEFNLNEAKRIINVTLSGNITDAENNLPMTFDQSWKYAVTEETDEKAFIEFKADKGSVSISSLRSYNIGTKIGISYKEDDPAYQFIKWDYDETILDVEDPKQKDVIFLVKEKTSTAGITVKAITTARPRVISWVPYTTPTNTNFPKDSQIEITFNNPLPQDSEGLSQLNSISIGIGGNSVKSYFEAPYISGQTVIFTSKDIIPVSKNDTKKITVTIPPQFYTVVEGTKVTYGGDGYSFDYEINDKSSETARISFSAQEGSGTIEPGNGPFSYSLGEEVNIAFNMNSDYEFTGWVVKRNDKEVSSSLISIEDPKSSSTKMIVKAALQGVTVEAQTKHLFKIMSITPENSYDGVECDTPIVITFSKPVDSDTISFGTNGSIMITEPNDIYTHYEKYFEPPVCDENVVTIKPKTSIRNLLEGEYSMKNLMISVISKEKSEIKDTDEEQNNLEESNTTSIYRINYSMETDPPEIDEFGVFKLQYENYEETGEYEQLTDKPYLDEADELNWSFEADPLDLGDFAKNRVSSYIFFSYSAIDNGSGFKQLLVKETYLGEAWDYPYYYGTEYAESPYFDDYASYEYYELKSTDDGIVQLDFIFEDIAGNKAKKTVYVLKDTTIADKTFSPEECSPLSVKDLTVHKSGYEQYDIKMKQFKNDADVNDYMVSLNQTTKEQTLTFKYSNVNDYTSFFFDTAKPHYKIEYGYSENSLSEIRPVQKTNDYILFKFQRDITKICFVKITATDIIGNTRSVMRIFPCQVSIIGDQAKRQSDGIPYYGNDSLGNYEILNITKTEDFASLQNQYPGFDIQYYTFFPSSFLPDSQNVYRVYAQSSAGYNNNVRFYYDVKNVSVLNDTTYTPSGKYEMYVLPVFKYGNDIYYGTVAHGYYHHKCSMSTISNTTLPTDNSQFSCQLGTKIPSLGYYDVEIKWNNFTPSSSSEYGVIYKKYGDEDYKKKYGGLKFTLPSEYKYYVYIYQKTTDGKMSVSSVYQTVDLASEDTDNAPPFSRLQLLLNKYKNDRYLKHPDVNKLCLDSRMFPTDAHGLKKAQGYAEDSGMVELEYCLTPSNNGELLNLTAKDLYVRQLKKAVFHKDSNYILLDFDDFNTGKNDSTLSLKLTDVNGNIGIINLRASLYTIFKYSVKDIVQISLTTEGNLSYTKSSGMAGYNYIASSALIDDKWYYIGSDMTIHGDTDTSGNSYLSDGSSWTTKDKDVLNNSIFFSCRLLDVLDHQPSEIFNWYTSEVAYYCTEWEKRRLNVENGTTPNALDGVCNSKAVVSGFGGGYQIFYDAPCFAHTMIYPTRQIDYLTEVKNKYPTVLKEDYQVWEALGSERGLKILNADFTEGTASYYAPESEIPDGYTYVTIIHFADRTVVMTDVKEK